MAYSKALTNPSTVMCELCMVLGVGVGKRLSKCYMRASQPYSLLHHNTHNQENHTIPDIKLKKNHDGVWGEIVTEFINKVMVRLYFLRK